MKKLRARKKIDSYKNINSYLDAVYRKNKTFINESINKMYEGKVTFFGSQYKKTFKRLVRNEISEAKKGGINLNINRAIDKLNRRIGFTTYRELYQNTVKNLLKRADKLDDLRYLASMKNIRAKDFTYQGKFGRWTRYEYKGVNIDIDDSPEDDTIPTINLYWNKTPNMATK